MAEFKLYRINLDPQLLGKHPLVYDLTLYGLLQMIHEEKETKIRKKK